MGAADAVGVAWDELEPPVLRFVLRVVLAVGAVVAAPFLALAFLFFLLEKPFLWWIAVPLAVAALVLLLAVGAWLFVRSKLRDLRGHVGRAARVEDALRGGRPPDEVVIDTDTGTRK